MMLTNMYIHVCLCHIEQVFVLPYCFSLLTNHNIPKSMITAFIFLN